jgi:hypothetical protein
MTALLYGGSTGIGWWASKLLFALVGGRYGPPSLLNGPGVIHAAGAGVAEHVHLHIVPCWAGDVNYMMAVGETRVILQSLDETYAAFRPLFDALRDGFLDSLCTIG